MLVNLIDAVTGLTPPPEPEDILEAVTPPPEEPEEFIGEVTQPKATLRMTEGEDASETVRNKRQMATTGFQNFDQKANQLFNMLATVMKNKKEMESNITRNML
jgi:hypothetical protein